MNYRSSHLSRPGPPDPATELQKISGDITSGDAGASAKGQIRVQRLVEWWTRRHPDRPLWSAANADVQQFVHDLLRLGVGQAEIDATTAHLSRCWEWSRGARSGVSEPVSGTSPASGGVLPKPPKEPAMLFTDEHWSKLMQECLSEDNGAERKRNALLAFAVAITGDINVGHLTSDSLSFDPNTGNFLLLVPRVATASIGPHRWVGTYQAGSRSGSPRGRCSPPLKGTGGRYPDNARFNESVAKGMNGGIGAATVYRALKGVAKLVGLTSLQPQELRGWMMRSTLVGENRHAPASLEGRKKVARKKRKKKREKRSDSGRGHRPEAKDDFLEPDEPRPPSRRARRPPGHR